MYEQIKILCVKLNISISKMARICGKSPQAFLQKMKRESFTPGELKEIAQKFGCEYHTCFKMPNGDKINY